MTEEQMVREEILLTDEELLGIIIESDAQSHSCDCTLGEAVENSRRAIAKAQAKTTANEILDRVEKLFHSGNTIRPPEIYSMRCIYPEQWQQLQKEIKAKK